MRPTSRDHEPILRFWFGEDAGDPEAIAGRKPLWFGSDPTVDAAIRERFYDTWSAAARGALDSWASEPRGALALVIVLDQLSRNLHRGAAAAFAQDARALAQALAVIDAGEDRGLDPPERSFLYLPLEHAEDRELQRRSVALFAALVEDAGPRWREFTEDALRWARLHQQIVERFGRFPHRNRLLDRRATADEERYLDEGGHSFGQ